MALDKKTEKKLNRYKRLIEKQIGTGAKSKPIGDEVYDDIDDNFRQDGFINVMNKYGTAKDTTEHYYYEREPFVHDDYITSFYESNGLFAKIIDLPADESVKHGFILDGVKNEKIENFYKKSLDQLDWEEKLTNAIKWTRLYGGAIMVILVNDGRKLEEPVDYKNIQSIDDIIVYERPIVVPDMSTIYHYESPNPGDTAGSRLGYPETYGIYSRYGSFRVHETRCLIFRNGVLPERTMNQNYRLWGVPEYLRIKDAIRDSEIAHGSAVKMLDRSIQAVYSMKNLAELLETDEGEDIVLKRLEVIDMARGLLNSIAIDNEGEDYNFRQFSFSGVSEVVDTTCNYLAALTNIPQTVLFGRDPSGMNATGKSDLENYYNFVERIQKRMIKNNLRYLLSLIFKAGMYTKEIDVMPEINIKFNPLWSLTELEEAQLEQTKVGVQQAKAQVASTYIQAQVLDPSEVRKKLADENEFDIDTMLDDYTEEELEENDPAKKAQEQQAMGGEGGMPDMSSLMGGGGGMPMQPKEDEEDEKTVETAKGHFSKLQKKGETESTSHQDNGGSVGVIVVKDGKVLVGTRLLGDGGGTICGAGGHIEEGETPVQAASREMREEFNIIPNDLTYIGRGAIEISGYEPYIFLCTSYNGEPKCTSDEMIKARFMSLEELRDNIHSLFQPFKSSLNMLLNILNEHVEGIKFSNYFGKSIDNFDGNVYNSIWNKDGGEGSGNFNHGGRKGKVGGSSKETQHKRYPRNVEKKYEQRVLGMTTKNGIEVKNFTIHSFERICERGISKKKVEDCLNSEDVVKSQREGNCYECSTETNKVIIDNKGNIVTVMWRWDNGKVPKETN